MIHTKIGKYRVDPLTESERSNIIDQVYFTAENMLSSMKELHKNQLPMQQQQQRHQEKEKDVMDTTMVDDTSSPTLNRVKKRLFLFVCLSFH